MTPTLERALAAYGGEALWRNAKSIEANIDTHGLAFTLKRRPVYTHVKLRLEVNEPVAQLSPIGKLDGITGVLKGSDVMLIDASGTVINERKDARRSFSNFRQNFWWDDLDMSYFGNYAMWNYLALPALLLRDDIQWRELKPGTLEATFPGHLPTHCKVQQFHFDLETGLLKQHDYTAEVISKMAKAANRVIEHQTNEDGVVFTAQRLVTPRSAAGKALPFPRLIEISVRDFKVGQK